MHRRRYPVRAPSLPQPCRDVPGAHRRAGHDGGNSGAPAPLSGDDMKLVRYGQPGAEKPGLIDGQGTLRDLSGEIGDIDGAALQPAALAHLASLEPARLPAVTNRPRLGPAINRIGKI